MSVEAKNYTVYHLHSELSLQDSVTKFQDYIDKAVELGQRAIAFTEHGNTYQWVAKKMACDKAGIKYIHGVECYLTEKLWHDQVKADAKTGECYHERVKVRDNFHTILLARNYEGLKEINKVIYLSTRDDHFYYKPRITFDEFLRLSPNVIKISACLASPLNKLPCSHVMYQRLLRQYDYLEIQPHNHPDQAAFNIHLADMSAKYGIPLIAGTDTHNLNSYKAECRGLILESKRIGYSDEDAFDLTYKSYDELVEAFQRQDALPMSLCLQAIENTNRMADEVESFELDLSFKYPKLYGDRDKEVFMETIWRNFDAKIAEGAITPDQIDAFKAAIEEECRVFDKIDMSGFMLFMSELVTWCKSNGIPIGFNRGSCGGSRVAYITNTTDLNPETWHTVFSRFCNEDRKEIGDIDIDVSPSDRDRVYEYIIDRFGQEKTAYILAIGTIKSKGCIDEIVRAFGMRWDKAHLKDEKPLKDAIKTLRATPESLDRDAWVTDENGQKIIVANLDNDEKKYLIKRFTELHKQMKEENEEIGKLNPYTLKFGDQVKKEFESNPDKAREKYKDIFYYYDGLLGVAVSQSMHPAGIVASPVTLPDNYGTFYSEGKTILQIDMECVHEVSLVKYDILGLKNIEIIKDAYELIGKLYPKSHEINWDDQAVWKDMLRSPVGIFQFEGEQNCPR